MADLVFFTSKNSNRPKKILPRDLKGSVELKDGTGKIICMRSVDDYLEIYKIDMLFKFYHPNTLDPERKNPEMKSIIKKIKKGTSNKIIARGYLQLYDILEAAPVKRSISKEKVKSLLKEGRDYLLDCEDAFIRFKNNYKICEKKINKNQLGEMSNVYTDFPITNNINEITTSYLINAKRFICIQVNIFNVFFDTQIQAPRTDKITEWLKENLKEEKDFLYSLEQIEKPIKQIIDFRNYQEHPSSKNKLVIEDFKCLKNNEISPPIWYIDKSQKRNLYNDLENIIDFLIYFAETILINSVFSNLHSFPLPLRIEEKAINDINPYCPIKYVLLSEAPNNKYVKVGNQIGFENYFDKNLLE